MARSQGAHLNSSKLSLKPQPLVERLLSEMRLALEAIEAGDLDRARYMLQAASNDAAPCTRFAAHLSGKPSESREISLTAYALDSANRQCFQQIGGKSMAGTKGRSGGPRKNAGGWRPRAGRKRNDGQQNKSERQAQLAQSNNKNREDTP